MAAVKLDAGLRARVNPSDVVQLAMTRMVNGFADFRGSTSAEFYAWLNSILRNEILTLRRDMHRARRDVSRDRPLENGTGEQNPARHSDPAEKLLLKEKLSRFHQIINKLPSDYASVIQFRGIEEMAFDEIAERMERTVDSVYKLWSRALIKLSEELAVLDESIS